MFYRLFRMSLPPNMTPEEYFKECVDFFEKYQFLYNVPNTDVLANGSLDKINVQNLENKDVFDDSYKITEDEDDFLKIFFNKCSKIAVKYDEFEGSCEEIVDAPLSEKKRHEITYLTKEIIDVCEETGCDTIVDFGAGLGYLDQLLYQKSNYNILGIESNSNHYIGAKKRQNKYHIDSIDSVKYMKHTISEDSHTKIQEYIEEKFPKTREFCVTGLHACADLTITAMNIFSKMAAAKSMVLIPCCYHLMLIENGRFKNFPLSQCLKRIVEKRNGFSYMGVPFLRLGAHPPDLNGSLKDMVFNLLARAVLQIYACKHDCKLRRNKRKAVKIKNSNNDFESYIQEAITSGFTLIPNGNTENIVNLNLEEIRTIWRQHSQDSTFKKAAIFVKLQNHLQVVIENFILYDRLFYLRENGVTNCRFKKILNESVSPRCLALLVFKNKTS